MNTSGDDGEMPSNILQLPVSGHRIKTMKIYLSSRGIRGISRLSKTSLLTKLREIERAISPLEAKVVAKVI